jgi:hypothetical protein
VTVLIWIVTRVVGVGAGLLVCGFVIEIFASFLDGRRHPAPGTMIDVGGRRLHLL